MYYMLMAHQMVLPNNNYGISTLEQLAILNQSLGATSAADFADAVPDVDAQAKIKASSHFAFGSHLMKAQFSTWASSSTISAIMLPMAAAIFVFDAIIQNPDRRGTNPNCLIRGNDLRIFDHELAFAHEIIIGWRPPWVAGGLNTLERPGNHIFRNGLRRQAIDYGPIRDAWQGLSDEQIVAYEGICPEEWADANAAITAAVALIRDAHDHIDGCLTEVKRVML